MLLSPGWNKRNPSPSWNAPSPSQQHYQPELSSTTRSKSVRAVLEFKDKASIDWCAEAQALNRFDKRPCLFEKSKAPRTVTRIWAGTVSCHVRGQTEDLWLPFLLSNSPYHVWNSPQHSSNCRAQLSGSLGTENQSHGIQVSALHIGKADSSSSVTQEGLVCPTETKTLLH